MPDWVEINYPVAWGGYYEDHFWADSNTVQQVVSASANHATVIEQARIIKLLETQYEQGGYEMGIVPHFIALIKGEIE